MKKLDPNGFIEIVPDVYLACVTHSTDPRRALLEGCESEERLGIVGGDCDGLPCEQCALYRRQPKHISDAVREAVDELKGEVPAV